MLVISVVLPTFIVLSLVTFKVRFLSVNAPNYVTAIRVIILSIISLFSRYVN